MKPPTTTGIIARILTATPEQLQAVSDALDGEPLAIKKDLRLNTPAQAARRLNMHRVALWRKAKAGIIPPVYVGPTRQMMIPEAALEAYAAGVGGKK